MASPYVILRTQNWSYLDEAGQAVDGFRIFFRLPDLDEVYYINVRSLNPALVKEVVMRFADNRKALATS